MSYYDRPHNYRRSGNPFLKGVFVAVILAVIVAMFVGTQQIKKASVEEEANSDQMPKIHLALPKFGHHHHDEQP